MKTIFCLWLKVEKEARGESQGTFLHSNERHNSAASVFKAGKDIIIFFFFKKQSLSYLMHKNPDCSPGTLKNT